MTNRKTLPKDVLLLVAFFAIGAVVGWLTYRPYCVWFIERLLDNRYYVVATTDPMEALMLHATYAGACGVLLAAVMLARMLSGLRAWWFPVPMLLFGLACSWALAILARPRMEPAVTKLLARPEARGMFRMEELHLAWPLLAGAGVVLVLALGLRVLRKAEENA